MLRAASTTRRIVGTRSMAPTLASYPAHRVLSSDASRQASFPAVRQMSTVEGGRMSAMDRAKAFLRKYARKRPHDYRVRTRIGTLAPGQDAQEEMRYTFRELAKKAVPSRGLSDATPTGERREAILFGGVTSTLYEDRLRIVNRTLPDHWLHQGEVERQVGIEDRDIYAYTHGTGTGPFARTNTFFAKPLWGGIMSYTMRREFEKRKAAFEAARREEEEN